MNYLVDTHCHLDLIEEKGIGIENIIANCQQNNVRILQTISTKISNFAKILQYTKHHNIFCSVGVHPCNVYQEGIVNAQTIIDLCNKHSKIIGIGETGLDYFHDLNFIDQQQQSFIEHIIASQQTGLPLIVHSRNADDDTIKILQQYLQQQKFNIVLHCFSGSQKLADFAIANNIYMSVAGIVTFKNATDLQNTVKQIPLELLLLETDSPYLAPMPNRGKVNEPSNILHTAQFIADLKNISLAELMQATTSNFYKIISSRINGLLY